MANYSNQYFSLCKGSTGEKYAAYNEKWNRCLMVEEVSYRNVATVLPDHMGVKTGNSIYESEAAVLFHLMQQVIPVKDSVIRVIDAGESGTNLSMVECSKHHIKRLYTKRIPLSGRKMTDIVSRVLKSKVNSGQVTYKQAEHLKVNMGLNNKKQDEISVKGVDVKMTRREFNSCCSEWLLKLLMELDYLDLECRKKGIPKATATIVCGGVGECEAIVRRLKQRYEGTYVTNYKASEASTLGGAIYAKQIFGRD